MSLAPPADVESNEHIERDRRQAVMEWTPGANVVVANRRWIVRGLAPDKRRGRMETHHRLFTLLKCQKCGHQHISRSADLGDCPACSAKEKDIFSIAIPYAFASEETSKLAGTEATLPSSRASRILTLDDRQWPEGILSFRSSVPVAFLNLGIDEKGYWLCHGCGRLRNAGEKWAPCCKRDSQAAPEPIVLGEVVRMDVLRIRPGSLTTHEGLRSASQALRLSAAFLLELDPRSMALADILEDGLNTIYLVDLTDGGSGLLARLLEPERRQDWLALARRILTHEAHPEAACANACPECLLTHDNRSDHRRKPFRRLRGIETMDALVADFAAEPHGGEDPVLESPEPAPPAPWSWQDVETLTVLPREFIHRLQAEGLPAPEVGRDLISHGETMGVAELCWPDRRVALLEIHVSIPDLPGWELVEISDAECITKLRAAVLQQTGTLPPVKV